METLLVIEDSHLMQRTLRRLFESAGMQVKVAVDGASGLEIFRSQPPSAVVLDLKLPRLPGRELCRVFKTEQPSVPLIVLSASADVGDKVLLLELGADDYVTKPFSPKELLARVRRVLRRNILLQQSVETSGTHSIQRDVLTFGDVRIDFTSLEATRAGKHFPLTAQEFKLLRFFASVPETVISRETLLGEVWKPENYPTTRTVDTFMLNLRKKLESDPDRPRHFLTIYGRGYKFSPTGQTDPQD